MSRFLLAAAVVAVAVVAAPALNAQTRPDFSGRWTLVADRSTPAGTNALGDAVTISQTPTSVALEVQAERVRFVAGPAGTQMTSEPGVLVKTVYTGDGADHSFEESAAPAQNSQLKVIRTYFSAGTNRIYRAVWSGDQFIIMRHETITVSRNQAEPVIVRRVIRQAMVLDKDGTLVVDSLIVADPMPEGFFFNAQPAPQPAPIPVRSVYRKAQ